MMTKWIKQVKPDLQRLCAGAASVVANSQLLAIYQPIMKTLGSRMYGFPLAIFTDIEEARQWAHGQLA